MIKQRESLIFHIVHSFLTGFKGIFFIISVSYHIFTSVFYFYRIIIRYWFINQQLLHTLKLIYRNPANRRRRKKRKKLQVFMFLSFWSLPLIAGYCCTVIRIYKNYKINIISFMWVKVKVYSNKNVKTEKMLWARNIKWIVIKSNWKICHAQLKHLWSLTL